MKMDKLKKNYKTNNLSVLPLFISNESLFKNNILGYLLMQEKSFSGHKV
jgi:hypothetical protein